MDTYIFHIRPAAPQDCPGLAQVQVDSYRTAYARFFPPPYFEQITYAEQEQDWRDWLASGTQGILLVALSADELSRRRAAFKSPPFKHTRGTLYKYIKNVKTASDGCVTDE